MSNGRPKIAILGSSALKKVRALESELGVVLVAYEQQVRLARLPPAKLREVQQLEKKLGVILMAYQ